MGYENYSRTKTFQDGLSKSSIKEFNYNLINTDISDYEQMMCMSLCQHNIIANSSFSWRVFF